jgi:shikimate dehydrogenase
VYVPLAAADFDDFLTFADRLGIAGASVTIPFKLDALHAAASADDLTRRVGAANTLRRTSDGWEATNTDVGGFLAPLEESLGDARSLKGMRASVLGAGGAARAVVVALMSKGALVRVHARRIEQADYVALALGARTGPWPPDDGSWDLLVNCTPLGSPSLPAVSPLPEGHLEGRVVYDLTYGAEPSPLIREARRAGCIALDGLPMLIAQAERQFEWWTGSAPPPGVMKAAVFAQTGRTNPAAGTP